VSEGFAFEQSVGLVAADAAALLRAVPAAPGVFALRGDAGEPYLSKAADMRRRLQRLLAPAEVDAEGRAVLSRRLNLRDRVRHVAWTRTGSEFESTVVLYQASRAAFGAEEARRRLRLHAPYFLRVTMEHAHPRVYATNRLTKKGLGESFGPFASRSAAERYCDAVLDLFLLRRCWEDLQPYPEHPGCVYGEMNKCMRPCQQGGGQACSPEQYAEEARRVRAFFATRGTSLLDEVAAQRQAASEAMDFEHAAELHKHWEKVKAASLLGDELVRPVSELRALVVQEVAPRDGERAEEAAVFLLEHGRIVGPARLSTLGVRAVREQTAVGSSLFAQPLMLAAVPLPDEGIAAAPTSQNRDPSASSGQAVGQPESAATLTPEERARGVLTALEAEAAGELELNELCDALALFKRWYYRPERQRAGEVFLPNGDGSWPVRRILNGAARVVLGPPAQVSAVDREAAKAMKTKVIHAGREGVERVVPVLPKRVRSSSSEGGGA
jgi:hypothetical protein